MSTAKCDLVPIFPSPRVLSVYSIDDRVYTVYNTGVYYGTNEIVSFRSKIADSTLCGQAIALFLSDSSLIVISPRTLLDEHYWGTQAELAKETTGVSHFHEMMPKGAQLISADQSGSLIAVHLGFSTVAIYEYSVASHRLRSIKTTIVEHNFSLFQIVSVGSMPYLWTVGLDDELGYVLELHEIASLAFKHTAGRALCRLPLNIPREQLVVEQNVQLLPGGERDGALLVYAARRLFLITLGSAIAGDAHPTLYPTMDWICDLFYTQSSSAIRELFASNSDGFVFKLRVDPDQKSVHASPNPVSELPEYALSTPDKWFKAKPTNSGVVCVPRSGTRITQCELDTRKWPWRTLVLSGSHMTAMVPVITAEYAGKSTLQNLTSVLTMTQVPRLKSLFISTTSGTGWLSEGDFRFDEFQDKILLAIGIIGTHMVTVFADRVELRSMLAPYNVLNTWYVGASDLVLDASVGSRICLLRFSERVVAIRINSNTIEATEVISDLTTSFVRCDHGRNFIGVALHSENDHYALNQMLSRTTGVKGRSPGSESVSGATLCFSDDIDCLVSVKYHCFLPTDLVQLSGGTDVVLYGADGRVALFPKNETPSMYNVLGSVNVAGRLGSHKQSVILYGRGGLWAATDEGLRMVCDRKSRKLGDLVQCACTLTDDTIAVVMKGELRFLKSPLSYGNQLPAQLQTVNNLAKNTRMLLVPSKRIVIVHGGSVCTFMDSLTFEPLLVSGLRAQCCDEVCLWKFELDGNPYEHLLFSNGKAAIESYSFERNNSEVSLTCKLRFLVSRDNDVTLRKHEVLHCWNEFVYLGRHDYLLKADPMNNRRFGPIYFDSEVRFVSQVENYVIVSTERSIHILDATEFKIRASMPLGKGNAGHVAGFVDIEGKRLLHILCAREKERLAIFVFDDSLGKLKMELPRLKGLSEKEFRVRSLSRLSTRTTDTGFSVLAVMMDYSIKNIAIRSPSESSGIIEIF